MGAGASAPASWAKYNAVNKNNHHTPENPTIEMPVPWEQPREQPVLLSEVHESHWEIGQAEALLLYWELSGKVSFHFLRVRISYSIILKHEGPCKAPNQHFMALSQEGHSTQGELSKATAGAQRLMLLAQEHHPSGWQQRDPMGCPCVL